MGRDSSVWLARHMQMFGLAIDICTQEICENNRAQWAHEPPVFCANTHHVPSLLFKQVAPVQYHTKYFNGANLNPNPNKGAKNGPICNIIRAVFTESRLA